MCAVQRGGQQRQQGGGQAEQDEQRRGSGGGEAGEGEEAGATLALVAEFLPGQVGGGEGVGR